MVNNGLCLERLHRNFLNHLKSSSNPNQNNPAWKGDEYFHCFGLIQNRLPTSPNSAKSDSCSCPALHTVTTVMQVKVLAESSISHQVFLGLTAEWKHLVWVSGIFPWPDPAAVSWGQTPTCSSVSPAARPSRLWFLLSRVSQEWIIKPRQSSLSLPCPESAAAQWELRASPLSCSGSQLISAVCFRGSERKNTQQSSKAA